MELNPKKFYHLHLYLQTILVNMATVEKGLS